LTGQLRTDKVARRVNSEIVVVLGWGRAILLQLAHPLVAAGVAEHSGFRLGSLEYVRRTHRTISAMLRLTYGSPEEIRHQADSINAIHRRVHGHLRQPTRRYSAGTYYSATDPELLRWVHATLVESQILTFETFVGDLEPGDKDRYCEEAASVGPLLGIPAGYLPENESDLRLYLREMLESDQIEITQAARDVARALLYPPGVAVRSMLAFGRLVTTGLLPAELRRAYGFVWEQPQQRRLGTVVRAVRGLRRVLPARLREWPISRNATP